MQPAADGARQLTRDVRRGDAGAVASLYESRYDLVFRAARRAGFDEQRSLDIVQDTFMKAIRAMPPIDSDATLDAWLRRIATRTALDALRSERRRAAREQRSSPPAAGDQDERIRSLRRELADLDAEHLHLLQLRHQAGLTLDAIARRVGLSAGAVDGRLRRAASRLRKRLEEEL